MGDSRKARSIWKRSDKQRGEGKVESDGKHFYRIDKKTGPTATNLLESSAPASKCVARAASKMNNQCPRCLASYRVLTGTTTAGAGCPAASATTGASSTVLTYFSTLSSDAYERSARMSPISLPIVSCLSCKTFVSKSIRVFVISRADRTQTPCFLSLWPKD